MGKCNYIYYLGHQIKINGQHEFGLVYNGPTLLCHCNIVVNSYIFQFLSIFDIADSSFFFFCIYIF